MTSWVEEALYPDWGQRFACKAEVARARSPYQDILVFESASHGRVLMLDGVVQITEADEFVYQEMMAHVPLLAHGAAERVLVVGGGDGGILRRVLQHRNVRRAVLVEIDEQVIALSKAHLPGIGGDAWADPRAEVVVGDAIHHVAEAPTGAFDAIIVDSTDPAGVGEVLFTEDFYRECARVLTGRGVVVNQGGVPFMQGDELRRSSARRAAFFPDTHAYCIAVPTYVGGFMAIGWGAKDPACRALAPAEVERRAAAAGVLGTTRYWTPEIHAGAFNLPPYVADCLRPA
ncbi:polyamine aminopropyltransferase [Craurococcus roseus]|uniref:Polyamine aminopropyltransferase n=1 Tax=Craurococcus roseus TaxID=77585 RepID=A0ABN1FHJ8_9PROT